MGHESPIELWSPNLTTFCFAGFGTDRLRCEEAMKTAGRENPTHGVAWPRNRAHGAEEQNRSRLIKWAAKQEKVQPKEMCFFLTSTFIELTRSTIATLCVCTRSGTLYARHCAENRSPAVRPSSPDHIHDRRRSTYACAGALLAAHDVAAREP